MHGRGHSIMHCKLTVPRIELCEDVPELEAHTRLQESNWELSEHQFGDGYDDGMEYDADA